MAILLIQMLSRTRVLPTDWVHGFKSKSMLGRSGKSTQSVGNMLFLDPYLVPLLQKNRGATNENWSTP